MLINRIKELLRAPAGEGEQAQSRHQADELQVAAAALMIEAARMDDRFDADEKAEIAGLVKVRFGLSDEEAQTLIETAHREVSRSEQLFPFTRLVKDRFSIEERVELMEMLWQVVYADEDLHHYEANLMRRIAGLLYVSDRDSGEARKRALARLARDRTAGA